jgi:hypothetical protein
MRKLIVFLCLLILVASNVHAQGERTLTYGQAVQGALESGQVGINYSFEGQAGDTIYVAMFAVDDIYDTELQLTAPNGDVLRRETDNGMAGSQVGPITLEADGTYTVLAAKPDWESDSSGDFMLLVDRAEIQPLTLGETITGTLAQPGSMTFFTYQGEAGDLIRYTLRGSAIGLHFDPPSDEFGIYSGMYDNPDTLLQPIRESGEYTVSIQTGLGTDYSLIIEPIEPLPLSASETATGTISSFNPLVFAFESAAGKMWQMNGRIDDSEFSTRLLVFNGNDPSYSIAGDGASGPGGFPRIDPFIAPEDATYYVVLILDWDPNSEITRDYELSVSPSSLLSLSPGLPVTGTITTETGNVVYAYSGRAGELIRLTFTRTGETGWPGLNLYSMASQSSVMDFGVYSGTRTFTSEVLLPDTGLYLFTIRQQDYEGSAMTFTIMVEQVQ